MSSRVLELTAEPIGPTGDPAELGEGPLWLGGERVSWVDILGGRVFDGRLTGAAEEPRTDAAPPAAATLTVASVYDAGRHVGAAVPVAGGDGWLLAAAQGFAHLRADGTVAELAQPARDERTPGGSAVRMNDAKCDPAGRLWAGTMAYDAAPGAGALWCVDLDGSVRAVRRGLTIANGLGWSLDGRTIFFVDSEPGVVWSAPFDVDAGALGEPRPLIEAFPPGGVPDGLCVDDDGTLWIACWGAGVVQRHAPGDGRVLARVRVAARQPSSCCIADGTLLVTSAWEGLERPGPADGRLFACAVGATAPPATRFAGTLPGAA